MVCEFLHVLALKMYQNYVIMKILSCFIIPHSFFRKFVCKSCTYTSFPLTLCNTFSFSLLLCLSLVVGKEELMIEAECITWTITPGRQPGSGPPWSQSGTLSSGSPSGASCRELCSSSTSDTSTR